jgi:hypothetical protein
MRSVETLLYMALWNLLTYASPTSQDDHEQPQWTYVPSPRNRGTLTILFTSCAALIASTWSALHLNVPKQKPDGDRSWRNIAKSTIYDLSFPIKWTVAMIIAPEALVGFAFSDWMHVRKTKSLLTIYGKNGIQLWNKTQIHFANMGGFVFVFEVPVDGEKYDEDYDEDYDEETLNICRQIIQEFHQPGYKLFVEATGQLYRFVSSIFRTAVDKILSLYRSNKSMPRVASDHARSLGVSSAIERSSSQDQITSLPSTSYLESGAETDSCADQVSSSTSENHGHEDLEPVPSASVGRDDAVNEIPKKRIEVYLNGTQILLAQRLGILNAPPEYSTKKILDKSKNTAFAKIFLLFPLGLLAYIVIGQVSGNLPVSQLELAVCSYGICTILACVFYWSKPQSIGVPESSSEQCRLVTKRDERVLSYFGGTSFIRTNFCPPFGADTSKYFRKITENISNDNVVGEFCSIYGTMLHNSDAASIIAGTIFGALYSLGWNSVFPNAVEMWLWRASSVIVTVGLFPYAMANTFFTRSYKSSKTHTDIRQKIGLYLILSCYVLARIFLIWEMFWSLFYQSEETFQNF